MTGQQKDTPAKITETRAEWIARFVAEAPPLTPAQRDLVAAVLRPFGGGNR